MVHITARARSFRYRQVRAMVGALVDVGLGRRRVADVAAMLEARDRTVGPTTAPPYGLYLTDVQYNGLGNWIFPADHVDGT